MNDRPDIRVELLSDPAFLSGARELISSVCKRLGFDEFEVSHPVLIERLKAGRMDGLPLHYQPAARSAKAGQKYSWRRHSAA